MGFWNRLGRAFEKVGDALEKGAKAVVDTAKGVVNSAVEAVKGVGNVVSALAQGDFKGAFKAAVGVLANAANALFTLATPALSVGSAFIAGAVGGKAGQIMGDLLGGPKALVGNVMSVATNELGSMAVDRCMTGGSHMPQRDVAMSTDKGSPSPFATRVDSLEMPSPGWVPLEMQQPGAMGYGMGSVTQTLDPSVGFSNAIGLSQLQQAQHAASSGDFAYFQAQAMATPRTGLGYGQGSVTQTLDPSVGFANVINLPLLQRAQQLANVGDFAGIHAMLYPQAQPAAAPAPVETPVTGTGDDLSVKSGDDKSAKSVEDTSEKSSDATSVKSGDDKAAKSGDDTSMKSSEDTSVKSGDDKSAKSSDDTSVNSDKSEADSVGQGGIETADTTSSVKTEPEKSVELT